MVLSQNFPCVSGLVRYVLYGLQRSTHRDRQSQNVTIHLHGRILSSLLEISQCINLKINFQGSVPAIIQLDPVISDLKFHFALGCEPRTFVVSPNPPDSEQGLGLSNISVSLADSEDNDTGRREYVFVDGQGRIATELAVSLGGKLGEQYKIEMSRREDGTKWTMEKIEKAAGMPVLNTR